jgi:hypothetical protein
MDARGIADCAYDLMAIGVHDEHIAFVRDVDQPRSRLEGEVVPALGVTERRARREMISRVRVIGTLGIERTRCGNGGGHKGRNEESIHDLTVRSKERGDGSGATAASRDARGLESVLRAEDEASAVVLSLDVELRVWRTVE